MTIDNNVILKVIKEIQDDNTIFTEYCQENYWQLWGIKKLLELQSKYNNIPDEIMENINDWIYKFAQKQRDEIYEQMTY